MSGNQEDLDCGKILEEHAAATKSAESGDAFKIVIGKLKSKATIEAELSAAKKARVLVDAKEAELAALKIKIDEKEEQLSVLKTDKGYRTDAEIELLQQDVDNIREVEQTVKTSVNVDGPINANIYYAYLAAREGLSSF